jgi:hypothetical protein
VGNVNAAGIWTPDEDDNLDPEVWSQAMADSIMNGIGERLKRQERYEGAYLNIQDPFTLTAGDPGHAQVPLPFIVGQGVNYLEGDMTLAGGVLKVAHEGLYQVNATIAAYIGDMAENEYLELTLWQNGSRHKQVEIFDDNTGHPLTLDCATTMRCVPGDTIWASGCQYFGNYDNPPTLNVNFSLFNTLTVTLIQAF